MKNCCVALLSAKLNNPNSDVALVTNIDLPKKYREFLSKNNILIFLESFDRFVFSDNYAWGLAFYKLCALSKIIEKYHYEYYAYLDSDVYIQGDFSVIWEECKQNILMYDINHGLQVPHYREIIEEFKSFFGEEKLLTHYGGEFFAANKKDATSFIEECLKIFDKMIKDNFVTKKGDEFIISIVASKFRDKIKNAGAYIYRFWTGSFFLVSTNYRFNQISILHLPAEKMNGMIKIYNRFISKSRLPKKEKVWSLCHLKKPCFKVRIKLIIIRIRNLFLRKK